MSANFTEVFGGNNIYPVQPSYSSLALAGNVTLQWPIEQAIAGQGVVTDIIDVTSSGPGFTIQLSDARQVSQGYTALFNNVGANSVSVLNAAGQTIATVAPGTVWQLYLSNNTTIGGTWRSFQFGASISVAVAAALAGPGLQAIGATLAEEMVLQPKNANYNAATSDLATILQWIGGVGTFTLPAPGTAGANWFVVAKNSGTGNLTINPSAGLIDGNASATLAPGSSAWYVTDGNNFYSLLGGGSSGGGNFNLLVINVSGSGNFPLSGAQLNQIGYRFTGALTGQLNIVVPNTAQEYWVDNETTGAFNLTVGTSGQASPIVVPQGNRYILYCDGTNVVNALTNSVAFPITIGQGGTGAITANGALVNLGGTTVGINVFTAVSQAAACTALGAVPNTTTVTAGSGLTGGGALSANITLSVDFTKVSPLTLTQNQQDANYQFALTDLINFVYHSSAANPTYTIPTNATVAFPIGSMLVVQVQAGAGALTISPAAGVGLTLAGPGTAGARTVSPNGFAVLFQRAANDWVISGAGIS